MRRLLGVLRQPASQPAWPGLSPQPGMAELAALAEGVRAAGLPVVLVIDGDPDQLPAAVDISAYRIVQEALTNVLKHAGQASAQVSVRCGADEVLIEVTDDGAGPPQAAGHEAGTAWPACASGWRCSAGSWPPGRSRTAGSRCGPGCPLGEQPRPAWPLQ